MKFLRMAGTWVPLFLAVMFIIAYVDGTYGSLTWERPLTYAIGCVSLFFGAWALIDIAKLPKGEFPTLLMLGLIYQKAFLGLIYFAIFGLSAHEVVPVIPTLSEPVLFALLVSSTFSTSMVSWLFWFGRKHPWLDVPVDPVPFRLIWRRIRNRR